MFFIYFVLVSFLTCFTESTIMCGFYCPELENQFTVRNNLTLCETKRTCLKNTRNINEPCHKENICPQPVYVEVQCSCFETYSAVCNCKRDCNDEECKISCNCFGKTNDGLEVLGNCWCGNFESGSILNSILSIFKNNKVIVISVLSALVLLIILIILLIIRCLKKKSKNNRQKRESLVNLRNNASTINHDEPVYHCGLNNFQQPANMNIYEELPACRNENEGEIVYLKPKRSSFHPK